MMLLDEEPRLEIHDNNYGSLFMHLVSIEKQGKTLGKIDDSGLFTCEMDRVPIKWVKLTEEDLCYGYSKDLYMLPRDGDILHSIRIYGRFKSAVLYQYSFFDHRIEYDIACGLDPEIGPDHITTMTPFPYSGIPLLQVGKKIYFELISEHADDPAPKCEIGYGYLDHAIRSDFNIKQGQTKGVSVLHKNGQRYAVFGVDSYGYSVNVMGPDTYEVVAATQTVDPYHIKSSKPGSEQDSTFEYQSGSDQISYKNPLFSGGHRKTS